MVAKDTDKFSVPQLRPLQLSRVPCPFLAAAGLNPSPATAEDALPDLNIKSMASATLRTALTDLLNIEYPIMCAGMGGVTMRHLTAAVSNAGGIGTIGAIGLSPEGLRAEIRAVKNLLKDASTPFGVDLLLPQVGGGARKTNKVCVSYCGLFPWSLSQLTEPMPGRTGGLARVGVRPRLVL